MLKPHSRFHKWYPVTAIELEGFLAITINMGLVDIPELDDYWSTSWITRTTFFSRVLPRDLFEMIFWLLHLSHEEDGTPVRRFDKIK